MYNKQRVTRACLGTLPSHSADFLGQRSSRCLHCYLQSNVKCWCVPAMPEVPGAIAGFLRRSCCAWPSCFSFLYTGQYSRKHSSSFLPRATFVRACSSGESRRRRSLPSCVVCVLAPPRCSNVPSLPLAALCKVCGGQLEPAALDTRAMYIRIYIMDLVLWCQVSLYCKVIW